MLPHAIRWLRLLKRDKSNFQGVQTEHHKWKRCLGWWLSGHHPRRIVMLLLMRCCMSWSSCRSLMAATCFCFLVFHCWNRSFLSFYHVDRTFFSLAFPFVYIFILKLFNTSFSLPLKKEIYKIVMHSWRIIIKIICISH